MSPLSDSEFYAELDRRMAMTEEDWKDFSRPLRRISNVNGLEIPRPASQRSTTPEDLNPVSNMNPQDFPSAAQSAQTAPENESGEAHMEVDHFPDLDPTGASSPLRSWTESPEKRKSSPIEDKPGRDAKRTRILSPELDASDPILPEDVRHRGATSISVAERTSNCEEISHFTETAIAPIYRPKHSAVEASNITSPGNSLLVAAPTRVKFANVPRFKDPRAPSGSSEKITAEKTKGKTKEKPKLVTPTEYAKTLQQQMLEPVTGVEDGVKVNAKSLKGREGKSPNLAFLKGLNIFYVGGDLTFASETTRKRMNYIHAKGGTVVPEYDPNFVTHIITEAGEGVTLRALGLKKLSEIPSEIPTLTWKWINSAKTVRKKGEKGVDVQMDHEFLYAAFKSRVDAGKQLSSRGKGKQKTGATERTPLPGLSRAPSTAAASGLEVENHPDPVASNDVEPKDDPLAEFEALARAERDAEADKVREEELGSVMTADVQTPSGSDVQSRPKLRGFLCDDPSKASLAQSTNCVNQDIIDTLTELMGLHDAKMGQEDKWRVFSYKKAIQSLRSCSERISSIQQARSLRGVGEKTAIKIMEIVETGKLRRIDYERTADIAVVKLFEGIYNVGQRTAYAWYAAGCRTLEDVENGKGGVKLSEAQEIGLRYYKDINTRIPRDEVDEIFRAIEAVALSIDSKVFIRCMGSYRRGKATCGDIDILITRPTDDGKTHHGMLPLLMAELHTARILTEDLSLSSSDSLETVYHGLCMRPLRPGEERDVRLRRRIDILTVPWECRGAALIYYTGDDIFNRSLRLKASKMGFSLNQRGLFAGVVRSPEDRTVKLSPGNIIASETEEDIFRILGVPWQEPHERVRG